MDLVTFTSYCFLLGFKVFQVESACEFWQDEGEKYFPFHVGKQSLLLSSWPQNSSIGKRFFLGPGIHGLGSDGWQVVWWSALGKGAQRNGSGSLGSVLTSV